MNALRLSLTMIILTSFTSMFADDMQDLRSVLAAQAGQSTISIPQGSYLLDFSENSSPLMLGNLKDVVIDFNGSTIVCNKQMQAFYIYGCENTVIKNFYLEYDPPTCTQGTITAIEGSVWTVALHDNYPTENIQLTRTQVYDSESRELIRDFTTLFEGSQTLSWAGSRTIKLSGYTSSSVKVGDYVVLTVLPDSYSAHAVYLSKCVNCKLENVTIYDSNCFSIFESDCERTHYYRCTVTRKLNDPKYPQDRLRAGVADALHSKHATVGPIVEECTLEHSGDDCIAINGSFYPVYNVNADTKTVYVLTTESSAANIKPKVGDTLVGVNNNGTLRGQNIINKVSTSYPTTAECSACFNKLSTIREQASYTNGAKIILNEWIDGLAIGDMVYSNDRIGSGFKVINNKVGHNRSRAILIKASDGEITGNTIEHSAMSAIAIAPEFYWLEAGCSQNLEISGNTIIDCMYDASMTGSSQAGALTVVAEAPNGQLAACGTFSNINIHGNEITGCPYPSVFLNAINGGYYYDNTIDAAPAFNRRHGANYMIPTTEAEYMRNCNLTFSAPTSLAQPIIGSNLILYINNGQLYVSGIDIPDIKVSIATTTGICLGEWTISPNQSIKLPAMASGIYIATAHWNGGKSSQKIIL